MAARLEDRVAAYVADHPGASAREIAKGVRARLSVVRGALGSPMFEQIVSAGGRNVPAVGYRLAGFVPHPSVVSAVGSSGSGSRASQNSRVLSVLADRQPHTMEEIHRLAGFMRLNSRVAELRKRGYVIECDKTGRRYAYQLIATPAERQAA